MTQEEIVQKILEANQLRQEGETAAAVQALEAVLEAEPNQPEALHMLGVIWMEQEKWAFAYQICRRVASINPNHAQTWNNLGKCCDELQRFEEAIMCFERAIEIDPGNPKGYGNAACALLNMGKYEEALAMATEGVAVDPDNRASHTNLGFARLGLHDWQGWSDYEWSLGGKGRREIVYGDEERWDGTKGLIVAVHPEQGVGDEIMFASVFEDAAKDCEQLIVECHPKLEGLFRRSFPGIRVEGTRKDLVCDWLDEVTPDARSSMANLCRFYRTDASQFPGTPYLKADPERRLQWRALFDSYKKPVIGIALTGGTKATAKHRRTLKFEDFLPLFRSIDAEWVSLEYRDRSDELREFCRKYDIVIHEFPWATKSDDYDDTAALLAELDEVIGIHTAALHCAAALGQSVTALIPEVPQWRYVKNEMPWYRSMRLFRQQSKEPWQQTVQRLADERKALRAAA
jgi:regulator of sirC expression with transglutaminase-like and TPR domain